MEININIPEERIKDILITAIESPPGTHWCKLTDCNKAPSIDGQIKLGIYDSFFHNNAGWMEFRDETGVLHILNWHSIHKGLKIMAEKVPFHFGNFLNDAHDAITADIFLQCCLLGEIVYG